MWALISSLCLLELVGYVRARRFVVAILHILVSGTLNEKVKMRKNAVFFTVGEPKINLQRKKKVISVKHRRKE